MKYKKILLKLSGESLSGKDKTGISREILDLYAEEIASLAKEGCMISIVIGGGNIFRGISGVSEGFDRVKGDQMGMLATVINSIALSGAIQKRGVRSKVFTAVRMEPVGEFYSRDRVNEEMANGVVCLIAGGTGNPFFTTDTAAALRAVETGADILLKGTRVDGIYDSDPEKDSNAVRFDTISFDEAIERRLKIMDLTAFTMCRENDMKVIVFDMNRKGSLRDIVMGEKRGTLVGNF
ncbi:MAG: UMP kinase [Bacteroidales bacterium]|nr:UMP kinase [Bacteroidales bacterium]